MQEELIAIRDSLLRNDHLEALHLLQARIAQRSTPQEQLPDDWDIKDLPKPTLTDTDRVVAVWHWAKSQPPSPAIQELLGILGEP